MERAPIKALETHWRGYRFRSRTEARWAVALTVADVRFEYEAQGFDLPSGWYLPDFWLPDRKLWLEIKGQDPNAREVKFAAEMSAAGQRLLIAVGPPDPDRWDLLMVEPDGEQYETRFDLPAKAYAAARAERFDGKPASSAPSRRPDPWRLHGW